MSADVEAGEALRLLGDDVDPVDPRAARTVAHVTGDGLAAALLLCDAVRGRTLAEAVAVMPRYAQAKENVRVSRREVPEEALAEAERLNQELNGSGRVLVRASGTEPLIRVLGEAETEEKALEYCARIAALVKRELG